MDKLTTTIGTLVTAAFIVLVAATMSGTILWVLYPSIHSLFPTAASSGIIAPQLGWWDSVCITWIITILFRKVNVKNHQEAE